MKKEAVGIINACSDLVAQLNAHPVGASIFTACFAMLLFVVLVFHLT